MKRIAALFLCASLGLLPVAQANGPDPARWVDAGDNWVYLKLKPGCTLIFLPDSNTSQYVGRESEFDWKMSTDGECNAQGLAHGRIRIDITYTRKSDGYVDERQVLEATAQNGILQGLATSTKYNEDFYDGGSFAMRLAFRDGCEYFVNRGTGQPDFNTPNSRWYDADCSSDRIASLRQAYLAGISPPAPTPPSSVSASSSFSPAPAGNADAWARCISQPVPRPRDGGIQAFWDITNSCPNAVIVRYCFRAQFEAAGDPNLCRRQEMRTHEIAPNGKLTFDFNLMPAGTVLSDGRTVTSNTLLVSGFACTGGNFPDAYFDSDGSFRSRGC